MGLDAIELILRVEDTFQIHIENGEAERARTVGDLYNLVISKLQGRDSERCLTSVAFYRTRRAIVDALGIDRRVIKPATPLDVILPANSRRVKWRRIQKEMTLRLPDLRHPGWIVLGLLFVAVALAFSAGIVGQIRGAWFIPLFLLGLIIGGFLIKLTPTLAIDFPNHEATVGDLSRDVLAVNHGRLVDEVGGWNKKDVWGTLCRVIVDELGVLPEDVTQEASFVDDLRVS